MSALTVPSEFLVGDTNQCQGQGQKVLLGFVSRTQDPSSKSSGQEIHLQRGVQGCDEAQHTW